MANPEGLPGAQVGAWEWQLDPDCPVDGCRRHALSSPERYGVWGGLSEHDRGGTRVRVGDRSVDPEPSPPGWEPTG